MNVLIEYVSVIKSILKLIIAGLAVLFSDFVLDTDYSNRIKFIYFFNILWNLSGLISPDSLLALNANHFLEKRKSLKENQWCDFQVGATHLRLLIRQMEVK